MGEDTERVAMMWYELRCFYADGTLYYETNILDWDIALSLYTSINTTHNYATLACSY